MKMYSYLLISSLMFFLHSCSAPIPDNEAPAFCGNGIIEIGEECDDQNRANGDGCDQNCLIEGEIIPPNLVFNEVIAKAANDGPDAIEIINLETFQVDLNGFRIEDDGANSFVFPEESFIEAGEILLLEKDAENSFTFGIGGDDALSLIDNQDTLLDFADWEEGDAPEGASFGRFPDGTGDFLTLFLPSPGEANLENPAEFCGNNRIEGGEACDGTDFGGQSCEKLGFIGGTLDCAVDCSEILTGNCEAAVFDVVINEVRSSADDEIELLNTGDVTVDLSGFFITDDSLNTFIFLDGTLIKPGEFLLLVKDVDHTFGLGGDDAVFFHDPTGALLDTADWLADEAVVSFCRIPDGTGDFQICSEASFGAVNIP